MKINGLKKFFFIFLFIALPLLGFFLGMQYQKGLSEQPESTMPTFASPTPKSPDTSPNITAKDPKTACEQNGGKWLTQYNECEATSGGLDEKTCMELGGVHKACDSACRHDPNAQGCIEVCINVCKF